LRPPRRDAASGPRRSWSRGDDAAYSSGRADEALGPRAWLAFTTCIAIAAALLVEKSLSDRDAAEGVR
jgi:hypothetical protein